MAGLTVTAGNGSGSGVGTVLAVDVLGGAAGRDSHPTHQFEAEANTHPPGGSSLFNAAGTGSWLYAAAEYGPATSPGGTTTGTRVLGFSNASIGAGLYRNTAGTTQGSSTGVSIGDTTPTCVAGEFVCAEILAAAGSSITLVDSQTAQGATATVTTPQLGAQPGALLVAYFGSYDGGAGVVQPSISDSWNLQWRQVSVRNTAGNGVAAVYVAQVPAAPPPPPSPAPGWFPGAPGMPYGEPFTPWPPPAPGTDSGATAISLAEAGSSAEALAISAAVPLAESGTSSETLSIAAAAALADSGSGSDALAVTVSAALAEAGSASDTLAVAAALSLADTGSGAVTLQVAAAIPLAESAAGADALLAGVAVSLADAGSAADAISVSTGASAHNATSAPLVTAVDTSAPAVSGPASSALVAARNTSSPGVSDG